MKSYRFSPITNAEQLNEALAYEVLEASKLCEKVTGELYPIESVSIFAHDEKEYAFLSRLLGTLGASVGENKGPRVTLHEPVVVGSNTVTHLRIRTPDDEHPQVGSNDFKVPDYFVFKSTYLSARPENLKLIVRPGYELIEMFDPTVDVLGYFLSEPERSKIGLV